jgi:hypothetical protein
MYQIAIYYRSRHPELPCIHLCSWLMGGCRSPPILHMHFLSYYANICVKVHIAVTTSVLVGPSVRLSVYDFLNWLVCPSDSFSELYDLGQLCHRFRDIWSESPR